MKSRQSYIFENGRWNQVATWVFNDGTSEIPNDIPAVSVNKNHIGSILRGLGLAVACIILILSTGFSIWSFVHRKSRVVRASQPLFLHIICVGIFLMEISIISLSLDDEIASDYVCSIACMSFPWLFCVGFATAFSALLAKTWRITKLFHVSTIRRMKVTPFDVMKPLFILLPGILYE